MANLANIAATNMEHLCTCEEHGYSQAERWGDSSRGSCTVECEGHISSFYRGDRDCSSAVIDSWQEALTGTEYEGCLNAASYTGNMVDVFTGSSLFSWQPMSFTAQRGDIYLNIADHTAMCVDDGSGSYGYDALAEFSISENGTIYGESGDQTGNESSIHAYYDFPWDGILHYEGPRDGSYSEPTQETASDTGNSGQPRYNVRNDDWCGDMYGCSDSTGSSDDFGGEYGEAATYIAIEGVGQYRVETQNGGVLDWVDHYDTNDYDWGCAGDGSPITKLWIPDGNVHYQVHTLGGEWLAEMIGGTDTSGSSDDFAGDGNPIDCIRIWR